VKTSRAPHKEKIRNAQTGSILIAGGSVLDLANPLEPLRRADILVENSTIVRIAVHENIECPAATRLDARGCIVLPGLTNAHTHSPENLAAGFCDGLGLESWRNAVWTRLDHLSADEVRLAVLLGAVQMLKQGVTAVVDHFRQTPATIEALDTARDTYERTGMRVILAVMLRDRVRNDGQLIGAPTGGGPLSTTAVRDFWQEVANRHRPQSRVAMGLGPSAPTRCTDAMLEMAVEISRQHTLYLHTHVAETRSESDAAQDLYGCRTIRYLNDLGFLGPRTSLAHCVWIDDEEVDLIARSGAVVAHNPISNMVLGTGIAPVRSLIDGKVHVAVGTDGAASNGAQNIWETIKCAALLARCGAPAPSEWLSARDALMLGVGGGRRVFGLPPGVIAENAVADIAVLPLAQETLDEFFDPVRALVYGAQALARHVLVSGDPVLVDGRITAFDEFELVAELQQIRKSFLAAQAGR
jgi:cytosine/adenosine deaminase-related metal-dependent hydrolase